MGPARSVGSRRHGVVRSLPGGLPPRLDRLRQSGWRGNGYVRWCHETNRGFLRALDGLRATAERIGEADEAERCALFLRQLDPDWPPEDRDV